MEKVVVKQVDLNVSNLERMVEFYRDIIGLKVIVQDKNSASLGSDRPLLNLYQIDSNQKVNSVGLYHFALLVPTDKDLGETLIHLLKVQAPLSGASDHGYSQALYLNDPEGNGIEIYSDRKVEDWDIREDGEIVGYTKEMDVQGLLKDVTQEFDGLVDGTIMGHVHLMVKDLDETYEFYSNLGFELKSNFGQQAKFLANGLYHHHIGTNTWHGTHLPLLKENQLGLRKIHFVLPENQKEPHISEVLDLVDPNGIPIRISFE